MFEKTTSFTNSSAVEQTIWIEPWCEELKIPSGVTYEFKGRGIQDGEFEIEQSGGFVIVYGWPSCLMSVVCNGNTIWKIDIEIPSVPPGVT